MRDLKYLGILLFKRRNCKKESENRVDQERKALTYFFGCTVRISYSVPSFIFQTLIFLTLHSLGEGQMGN